MPGGATTQGAALVTGAGVRIGRTLAIALAEAGYDVAIHYRRSEKPARETAALVEAAGRRSALVQADLASETETANLIGQAGEALGALSLVVNCASLFDYDDAMSMTRDSWDAHMNVNLRAPVKLTQDFAAQTKKGANNAVVNIIDQRVLKLTPQFFSYTLSKSALWTATQTMAQAFGPAGIRVNAIAPGPVLKNARQSDEDWRRQNEATVLGRGADPEGVARALLYLASARAVTGQLIAVDGGQHLVWQTPDVLVKE
jgi:NAD(P)-dependent dehydrogenase (short-subunit alcohol dehydrogenase family)